MKRGIETLFKAIEQSSKEISKNVTGNFKRQLSSANIYVANRDLSKWAFSKYVATSKFDKRYGAQAKPFFYNHGFINILKIKDDDFRNSVVSKFLIWSESVDFINLAQKYSADQKKSNRFELLVHIDEIPKHFFQSNDLLDENFDEFVEGFKNEIIKENSYRDRKLIDAAKKHFEPTCAICKFNFEKTYGLHGKGFIEMHHLIPISEGKRISTVKDLVPVCSNCHRMLHKGKITLDVEDIKKMIQKNRGIA
jgi:predicted HNH restriction endonuclease